MGELFRYTSNHYYTNSTILNAIVEERWSDLVIVGILFTNRGPTLYPHLCHFFHLLYLPCRNEYHLELNYYSIN